MLGPWTGNARKTGKISAEMDIHSSVMTMIRTLKLSVIQLTNILQHIIGEVYVSSPFSNIIKKNDICLLFIWEIITDLLNFNVSN